MILYVSGDLFQSPAQVLVNTVNTVGAMGKGIALQFKRIYPEMFREYQQLCESGALTIGKLHLFKTPNKWILNFPTKKHWRYPSRVEYIEAGLREFVRIYDPANIHSIAFPPLGCGNGRLDFATQVQPLMHQYLSPLPIEVFVYPEREDAFVAEHEDPKQMRAWLRGKPRLLPFSEVWEDLSRLVGDGITLSTYGDQVPCDIRLAQGEEEGILISVGMDEQHRVPSEALRGLWQQVRDLGFTMRSFAPGIEPRVVEFLLPLLAQLPYVQPVNISRDYAGLVRLPTVGLRVIEHRFGHDDVYQPTLFRMGLEANNT